jgi:hypothetical protein
MPLLGEFGRDAESEEVTVSVLKGLLDYDEAHFLLLGTFLD